MLTSVKGSLQPGDAVAVLDERVKLIGKVNLDIADWLSVRVIKLPRNKQAPAQHLQERRRVEDLYVQGLRKLANRRPQDASFELG